MAISGSKQKETGTKIVAMATSQYASSSFLMHNIGAKFQLTSSTLS